MDIIRIRDRDREDRKHHPSERRALWLSFWITVGLIMFVFLIHQVLKY